MATLDPSVSGGDCSFHHLSPTSPPLLYTLAMATVEFTLANLLYCFEWALPEGTAVSMEEEGKLTPLLKTPLVLVPTAYQQEKQV